MKILVFLHDLVLGGATVNFIELAAALRDRHGHEVVVFSTPGPMVKLVQDNGLRFLPAPVALCHPSPARMAALREAVRTEQPDLLYVWETWPCADAYCAVHLPMSLPMLVTDMQMFVTRLLPKELTTTFGTPELVDVAKASGRRKVELLVPPVHIRRNAPGVIDPAEFRRQWNIKTGDITLVTVSRLDDAVKSESLIRTVQAVRKLGRCIPLRLLIVGDGNARSRISRLTSQVNEELGRSAIQLTGAMLDPRPAYAAADIVVGMGGSALRAMAFGKPVVVVGERAFSSPFTSLTAQRFYYKGLYGIGNDPADDHLAADIESLLERQSDLADIGSFSREFVVRNFSLDVVCDQLSDICVKTAADKPRYPTAAIDALRSVAVYMRERRFLWRGPPPPSIDAQVHSPTTNQMPS